MKVYVCDCGDIFKTEKEFEEHLRFCDDRESDKV